MKAKNCLIVTHNKIITSYTKDAHSILNYYQELLDQDMDHLFNIETVKSELGPTPRSRLLNLQFKSEKIRKNLFSALVTASDSCELWVLSNQTPLVNELEKRKRHDALLASSFSSAFSISPYGLIMDCLKTDSSFLGFSPDEMIHQPLMAFVHVDDLSSLFCLLKQVSHLRQRISIRWLKKSVYAVAPTPEIECGSTSPNSPGPLATANHTVQRLAPIDREPPNPGSSVSSALVGMPLHSPPRDLRRRRSFSFSSTAPIAERLGASKEEYTWVELDASKVDDNILVLVKVIDSAKSWTSRISVLGSLSSVLGSLSSKLYPNIFPSINYSIPSKALVAFLNTPVTVGIARYWQSNVHSSYIVFLGDKVGLSSASFNGDSSPSIRKNPPLFALSVVQKVLLGICDYIAPKEVPGTGKERVA
ncbi:hypothetical protein HDV03_003599 [Kappamyces sp. JEL0829]|nr:hypothetical protein HDV03_003599 [Kappamyces sp. JEL0829]